MLTLDLRKLQQRLDKQSPSPLYVLCGDESFLLEESLTLLKSKVLEEGSKDFNYTSFMGSEASGPDVKDAVEMFPMMAKRRLVILRDVDQLKDRDWDALYSVIENPVDSTVFVLTCEALDKRKRPYKKLMDQSVWVDLKRPYDNQVPQWIDYLAFRAGLEISSEAASLLLQFVGVSLTELNNEILKLKSYLDERNKIEAEDVLKVVSRSRADRIFDLTDALGRRDKVTALTILANLLDHGQSEVGAVALLSRHFRILSQIRMLLKQGLTGPKICAKAGIPQFLFNNYLSQSKAWSEPSLIRVFQLLHQTDRALKSSNLASHIWLENLILKACE